MNVKGFIGLAVLVCALDVAGADGVPAGATVVEALSSDGATAHVEGQRVWLVVGQEGLERRRVVIPRLCAPVRSIRWMGDESREGIELGPEPGEWVISWKSAPEGQTVLLLELDAAPLLLDACPSAEPAGDGSVMLHAYQAETVGEKLRFEPQWYKNTVGYWAVPTDYAVWQVNIAQPGEYSIAVLQGCGEGQGGSEAVMSLRQGDAVKSSLEFVTVDTGHFQNFRWNHLGALKITEAGEYQLRIEPKRIARGALFDVRAIHLVRQARENDSAK
jgi:hypothetical protein